jgi:flavin-dependent dehydrogenase
VERVLVAEAARGDGARIGESIPPDTRLLLDRLGVTGRFLADGHEPCLGSCSAWGDAELGYNDFLFNPHGHGWHLDRRRFDASLVAEAKAAGAEVAAGWECKRAERGDGALALRLELDGQDGRTVRARLAVDATGRVARVARALGARRLVDDRVTCVVAFLRGGSASRLTRLTMLEAVEDGWWYAARLPAEGVVVAVAGDPDVVKRAELHTEEGWLAALGETEHLRGELEGCRIEEMVVRTAPSFALDPAAGEDWLAVGDAAAACDPIAAQGIHNALSDGLLAARAIAARLGGDRGALDGYREAIAARYAAYRSVRDHLYERERRWPDAPFWARRRARAAAAGLAG